MKKITIKIEELEGQELQFTLPDGRKVLVYDIGYEDVYTGEQAEPSQYRYTRYGDDYGFDIGEFDGKNVVEYSMGGFNEYDDDFLKFCKKVCLYYAKEISNNWRAEEFEMPSRYLDLVGVK